VHVLVVEPDPEKSRAIGAALGAAGHRVELLDSGTSALTALARPAAPDVVLIDESLDDMPALDFLQAAGGMAARPPVIFLGEDERAARWVEATRLGAVDFVLADRRGDYLRTLAARLQAAGRRTSGRGRAMRMADALASTSAAVVIADRAGRVEMLNDACARLLGRRGSETAGLELGTLFALDDQPRLKADLFAALEAGGEWAGEIEVRAPGDQRVPCMVTLSPIRRAGGGMEGLVLTLRDVSDRVAMEDALRAANRRLAEQASRDGLTGLYNRAYFLEVLEREMARAIRYGDVLSVLMIDLDEFKHVNDLHGHAAGDDVLREVAQGMRPGLRDDDVLARYGGDEFCVLLPNTLPEAGAAVAERLRSAVAAARYAPDGHTTVTVSVGLATSEDARRQEGSPTELVLRFADRALYASKNGGGDRVTVWSEDV
jgi:diguanylate cyclase (GGDEF)-like protein/PAS domain S-box-containing protein